jgi:hypothetical protein
MPKHKKTDWIAVWLNFVFGALVGAGVGLWVWLRPRWGLYNSSFASLVCVAGGALAVGLIAVILREGFWDSFER